MRINVNDLQFRIHGQTFQIGKDMFLLSCVEKARKWSYSSTRKVNIDEHIDEQFKRALENATFQTGHCYTNANKVCQIGRSLGINIEFYSGWLKIGEQFPIHHAWNSLNGILIDVSVRMSDVEGIRAVLRKYKGEPLTDEIRMEMIRLSNEFSLRKNRVFDDFICGKVPRELTYWGSPDDPDNARAIYNAVIRKYPKHPSYLGEGMNPHGKSRTQELLDSNSTSI